MRMCKMTPIERFDSLSALVMKNPDADLSGFRPLSSFQIQVEYAGSGSISKHDVLRVFDIISALQCFDQVMHEIIRTENRLYMLGDRSVFRLMTIGSEEVNECTDVCRSLEVLALLGLIYRFSVARKFDYCEGGMVQIRLNSWGRHLADMHDLVDSPRSKSLYGDWYDILSKRKIEYERVVCLCNSHNRPLDVHAIHKMNDVLPIPIVT